MKVYNEAMATEDGRHPDTVRLEKLAELMCPSYPAFPFVPSDLLGYRLYLPGFANGKRPDDLRALIDAQGPKGGIDG